MSFDKILAAGYVPYIATDSSLKESLNLKPFGLDPVIIDTKSENVNFHRAYLLANAVAFNDLKMPNWVYVNCVLSQSAVFGFARKRADIPASLFDHFENDPDIESSKLDLVPISGATSSLTADRETWFGFTLFSLQRYFSDGRDIPRIAAYTKAASFEMYGTKKFTGITQYYNRASKIHGLFGKMYLKSPIVHAHSVPDYTFMYEMDVNYDINTLEDKPEDGDYDFLLEQEDTAKKQEVEKGLAAGKKYVIVPPYQVRKDDKIYLPIKEE